MWIMSRVETIFPMPKDKESRVATVPTMPTKLTMSTMSRTMSTMAAMATPPAEQGVWRLLPLWTLLWTL